MDVMPIFGGVANEIILRIITETSADDIVSLASCCRHLNSLAQERLEFHAEKRANAQDIVVGWDQLAHRHPSRNLRDILKYDDCRFYTRVMRIGPLHGVHTDVDDEEDVQEGHHMQAMTTLVANVEIQYGHKVPALVAKVHAALMPYAQNCDVEEWTNKVKEGDPAAVIVLLLALYPNLETLVIHDRAQDWWINKECWGVILSLISIAKNPAVNKLRMFSKLSKFHLMGVGDDEGLEARAQLAVPFMTVPTMREILGDLVDGRKLEWSEGAGTSGVTVLNLNGDIDESSLSSLIRGCKALESFRYEFSPPLAWSKDVDGGDELNRLKWGPQTGRNVINNESDAGDSRKEISGDGKPYKDEADRPRWEPRAIVATLLECASNSLVSLNLTSASFEGIVTLSNDEPFIGSLRSFRALKKVFLDTMMLFRKVKRSSNVSLTLGESKQQTFGEDVRAQRLVEFLPVTIEELGMTSVYVGQGLSRDDVVEMFTGLPKARTRLPKLLNIKVAWWKGIRQNEEEKQGWKELRSRCLRNSIALLFKVVDYRD